MHFSTAAVIAIAGPALVSAAPVASFPTAPNGNQFKFPLDNGFPNPNDAAIKAIQQQAFGTLPNGPPPPTVSEEGLKNLQLIAFNELSEVAFFTQLINNITSNVDGFTFTDPKSKDFALSSLIAIQGQEQLHALNANNALVAFKKNPVLPCVYDFPVTNFIDAITLASTFTDVVLGTLQDVSQIFAENNDNGLVRGVASVIGNEAEQNGWFRVIQNLRPSSQPFLTTSTRDFAFSILQSFTVPGSCPSLKDIDIDIFAPLTVVTPPAAKDSNVKYSVDLATLAPSAQLDAFKKSNDYSSFSLVLINQQNVPVVQKIVNPKLSGTVITFEAFFPFTDKLLTGLTIAAVVEGSGPFANAPAVAAKTVFGPGLIEVN